jgi:SAM-dependent methyltransferase
VVLLRNRHGRPSREGATLDHVRLNEAMTYIAFGGRRRRVYGRIAELSGARPGDRVLDVGCGGGYLARLLSAAVEPGGQVTGLDTSAPAIGYARKRAPAKGPSRPVHAAVTDPHGGRAGVWPRRAEGMAVAMFGLSHVRQVAEMRKAPG